MRQGDMKVPRHPLDVPAELHGIQQQFPPGPLRRWAYQRLVSRIEQARAQCRDVGEKYRWGQKALYVKDLARKECKYSGTPSFPSSHQKKASFIAHEK